MPGYLKFFVEKTTIMKVRKNWFEYKHTFYVHSGTVFLTCFREQAIELHLCALEISMVFFV